MSKKSKKQKVNFQKLGFENETDENFEEVLEEEVLEEEVLEEEVLEEELIEEQELLDENDDMFKEIIETESIIMESDESSEVEEFSSYLVRVSIRLLKCFSGPGIDYAVRGFAKQNEEFIITQEKTDYRGMEWGKIESNETIWIPLKYCEKRVL